MLTRWVDTALTLSLCTDAKRCTRAANLKHRIWRSRCRVSEGSADVKGHA